MSCSNSSPCDDKPIGSQPAGDSCSPCQGVDSNDLNSLVKRLLDRVCTLEAQQKNWHALLERARNRLSAAELQLARAAAPPAAQSAVKINICDAEEVTEADAFATCSDGSAGLLKLTKCQFPIVNDDSKIVGRDYGPTWLQTSVALMTNVFTSNQSVSLSSYDKPACAKFAICQVNGRISTTTGEGNMAFQAHYPNLGAKTSAYAICSHGGVDQMLVILRIPILDDGTIKFNVIPTSNLATKTIILTLLGFE